MFSSAMTAVDTLAPALLFFHRRSVPMSEEEVAQLVGQKLVVRMDGAVPSASLLGRARRGDERRLFDRLELFEVHLDRLRLQLTRFFVQPSPDFQLDADANVIQAERYFGIRVLEIERERLVARDPVVLDVEAGGRVVRAGGAALVRPPRREPVWMATRLDRTPRPRRPRGTQRSGLAARSGAADLRLRPDRARRIGRIGPR